MTNFKGTFGKWKMFKEFSKCYSVESDSYIICNTVTKLYPTDKANALLISKAPELLAMLEEVFEMCNKKQFPTETELKTMAKKTKQLIKEATEL
jgi:hypothetical protein